MTYNYISRSDQVYNTLQRYFITNLAIADTLLSLAGTQRGLGLVSTDLLIGGPRTSVFCVIFALALNFVGYAYCVAEMFRTDHFVEEIIIRFLFLWGWVQLYFLNEL